MLWGRVPQGLLPDPPLPVPGEVGCWRGLPGGASGRRLPRAAGERGETLGSAAESYAASGTSLPFSLRALCPWRCEAGGGLSLFVSHTAPRSLLRRAKPLPAHRHSPAGPRGGSGHGPGAQTGDAVPLRGVRRGETALLFNLVGASRVLVVALHVDSTMEF